MVVGRQVLLRLRGYISVSPTLQLSHNDVGGVGAWGVLQRGGPESFPAERTIEMKWASWLIVIG